MDTQAGASRWGTGASCTVAFFFSSRRRHTRFDCDWSSDVCSSDLLLEETVARLEGLVPCERILILTNAEQEAAVRQLLTAFPKENIVAEPAKRDTAAAVALGTGWVAARDHAATMIVLPADHIIADGAAFQETLAL